MQWDIGCDKYVENYMYIYKYILYQKKCIQRKAILQKRHNIGRYTLYKYSWPS